MNKKILLLFPITAASLLVACGQQKETVTFWHNMNDNYVATLSKIVAAFEKENPGIKVELVKQDGGYPAILDKTEQGIPTDNYPDIFYGYPDSVQTLMNYGVVVDMDPYINNSEYGWTKAEKEDILADYLKEGQSYSVKGTYSLPLSKSTEAMWYSPRLVGLDLSAIDSTINGGKPLSKDYLGNLTWEDLFDKLCPALETYNATLPDTQKLYKPSSDKKSGIVGYDSDANLFITLAEQYGYGYTSVDQASGAGKLDFINDGMKGLMKKFNAAAQKGYFCTGGTCGKGYTNSYTTEGNALFAIGSTAGLSHQSTTTYKPIIGRIPHAAGKTAKVINQGPSVAFLSHKSETRLKNAWLFYKYWTNEVNAATWVIETQYLPIRKSTFASDAWAEYVGDASADQMVVDQSRYVQTVANELYSSPVFKGSSEARTQVEGLTTKALTEKNLTDATLDKLFQTAYDNTLKRM